MTSSTSLLISSSPNNYRKDGYPSTRLTSYKKSTLPLPKCSFVSSSPTPPTHLTSRTLPSDIFFRKTHWHPQSIYLPFVSTQQSRQNHWSPIMQCPPTKNPYGTWLMKNNTMVFITILKSGPTSRKNNTGSSIQLLVMPYQQSPSPPLRPTPTVSLDGPNIAYVLLVTLTLPTGHATRSLLQSFLRSNYAYSSLSLFKKDAKWNQDILNRHFVNHMFLVLRHMCYASLKIVPLPPQILTSRS